ncbi:hypothetical protein ACT3TQ_13225 [Halomonas sp. AOP12-C2-37]|uniref:hypothetical protein n=1 Tax=unclassified Halomonas TaxID=2609666 RepID=UPI0040339433
MAQLLSSASLILAVVGVFYSLWHSEIERALGTNMPSHMADRKAPISAIKNVLNYKAYPLAGMSLILFLIYLPVLISIIIKSLHVFFERFEAGHLPAYDPSKASLLLVIILMAALAFYSSKSALQLRRKIRDAGK